MSSEKISPLKISKMKSVTDTIKILIVSAKDIKIEKS